MEPRHLSELSFKRRCHGRGNHIRTRSGIKRQDLNCWIVDLWQRGNRKLLIGDQPRNQNSRHQEGRRDRTQNERSRWIHDMDTRLPRDLYEFPTAKIDLAENLDSADRDSSVEKKSSRVSRDL